MNELEVNSFLTSDYIYIPFDDKEKVNLRSNGIVYKNDLISERKGRQEFSPVSGRAFGYGQINTTTGLKNVLVIENDFKDKVSKKLVSVQDIYNVPKPIIEDITGHLIRNKVIVLNISNNSENDLKDELLLKDNLIDILETLNLIDMTYDGLEVKIRLNKRDIFSYQVLFTYLGTYPNIEIVFDSFNDEETVINLYDVIDIYDKLKVRNYRDYIYLTVIYNKKQEVLKVKRNSNLKDILEYIDIMSTKIVINDNLEIQSGNFLLDESVKMINIL